MTKRYTSEGCTDLVDSYENKVFVTRGKGYYCPGGVSMKLTDTGNGYIACFPSDSSTTQDYYICMDYAQARDLVLGLAEFKKNLGFV